MKDIRHNRHNLVVKKGFTLVEVLIACGIMVVVLGSTISTNRIIRNNANLAEDRAIMEGMADKIINTGWTAYQNGGLSNLFGVSDGQSFYGSFYYDHVPVLGNCFDQGSVDDCGIQSNSFAGPIYTRWCNINLGGVAPPKNCESIMSDTHITTSLGQSSSIPGLMSIIRSKKVNGEDAPGVFEAVKKGGTDSEGTTLGVLTPYSTIDDYLYADSAGSRKAWALYVIRSHIARTGNQYTLDVKVINYVDPSSNLTKSQTWTEN